MKQNIEMIQYYTPELLKALKETGQMIGISMIVGSLFGLFIGTLLFLLRKDGVYETVWLQRIINIFVNVIRSFPFLLLVVALIPLTRIVFGTAFGPIAASFSLSIVAIAIYARLVEQVLLDVPEETLELADSLGTTLPQLVFHFLWLEARSGLVLAVTSMLISLVSYSTIMGVVGGGGIGDFAIRYGYQRYEYGVMYFAIVVMIVIVGSIQMIGTNIATRLDKRKVGK